MEHLTPARSGISARTSYFLERYSGRIILAEIALTLLLIIPMLAMGSDDDASSDPGGMCLTSRMN